MARPRIRRANVLVVAALIVVTLGCAAPLWFYRRAADLNDLAHTVRWPRRTPRVRPDLCLLALAILAFTTIIAFAAPTAPAANLSSLGWVILLFQALATSRIIRRVGELHDVRVSSVLAALLTPFSPIYFQWKLNMLSDRRMTPKSLSNRGHR